MPGTPVEVHRTGEHTFTATNGRGGQVTIGRDGAPDAFTPGELLLAAIAGCSAVTSENLLVRRAGADADIAVHADRDKTDADPNKFSEVRVRFDVDLSSVAGADRAKLLDAVERAIERYCTVSRSVQESTPISLELPR
ncbi:MULTISPECIES: OsmC family protein [unclassified Saccharopolyspora]|uniref:OsmC family protein n=1 Tax=unclassified Saccharopolyspora TaxID=2646250 RepID=UPI001CD4116C|nr:MULTISPECIES: OsmC family protein [unclassified Saccharopolyspora]MCA1190525.1 OsmC family protein [Saccharopolyspora sp. 6T]MCA1196024.1 OsmC family protein [Saccharopolyspora sp. 6V]MCA1229686.1 OsmC family protein [Saccharopolyspora sp. 6M]